MAKVGAAADLHDSVDLEIDDALGSREIAGALLVPVDSRPTSELQRAADIEIDEEKTRATITRQVAERLEHSVSGVIRPGDARGVDDAHEAGIAAAMRGVGSPVRVAATNEERIGRAHPPLLSLIEASRRGGGRHRCGGVGILRDSRLDVLRAVAEYLPGDDVESTFACRDPAV